MPGRCVVANCSNVNDSVNGISLHPILLRNERPEAKKRRRQWLAFVFHKQKVTKKYSVIIFLDVTCIPSMYTLDVYPR